MHVQRLTELAALMDRVATEQSSALASTLTLDGLFVPEHLSDRIIAEIHPPTQFDLANWATPVDCGTSACAVGYAIFHPPFVAQGLRGRCGYTGGESLPYSFLASCTWLLAVTPEFDGQYDLYAAELFFELDHDDACALFLPTRYIGEITPTDVANRVRELLDLGYIASAQDEPDYDSSDDDSSDDDATDDDDDTDDTDDTTQADDGDAAVDAPDAADTVLATLLIDTLRIPTTV